jgi:alpha-1,3-rhamnosyl/mannosyltransferase
MDLAGAYGIHPLGISVTPLGVDERFQPQSRDLVAAVRAKYGMPERYVLTLASNKPHKNLPLLIEAWALLDELSPASVLVVAGHWDKRYPEAKEAVARLGLQHRVLFISHMADDDLPALYTGASLFVFPSRYEGFGLPPLEAMACGTPVVCGGVSSLPEVVGDAALTVDITRAEAVAEGIIKVLCDDRLRKAMSIRAKQQAARFSWRSTAEATLQVYERI